MIRLLQTRNFRMLRSNSVTLRPFQVLVGQNATGKSTFLGALQLIGNILKEGVNASVETVASSFYDLCFRDSEPIALAAELSVPQCSQPPRQLRYEIEIGIDGERGLRVLRENLFILPSDPSREGQNDLDIYLIEEPENGLHPLAIQVAFEALSKPPSQAQFLCATHSPIFLAHTSLDQSLVFRRATEGYSIVRRGPEIPELQEWTGRVNLSDLFVTGVLA